MLNIVAVPEKKLQQRPLDLAVEVLGDFEKYSFVVVVGKNGRKIFQKKTGERAIVGCLRWFD